MGIFGNLFGGGEKPTEGLSERDQQMAGVGPESSVDPAGGVDLLNNAAGGAEMAGTGQDVSAQPQAESSETVNVMQAPASPEASYVGDADVDLVAKQLAQSGIELSGEVQVQESAPMASASTENLSTESAPMATEPVVEQSSEAAEANPQTGNETQI